MYKTECPKCGGPLLVVSFKCSTRIPLHKDGFSTLDARWFDTEEEKVECIDCGRKYALAELMEENKGQVRGE